MLELPDTIEKCEEECLAQGDKFESIWDKYISSVKTLDPTKKLDPALFTSEAPTYLNGTTELPKTQKKESKPARKFGMEKVFRGKRVTLSDLLKLPVTSAGWWIGLGDSAEEEKLLEELEESMDVTEEIEETATSEQPKELDVFEDLTPDDKTLAEAPLMDKDFFLNLINPKYSWCGGFGKEGVDKPLIPRKIPKIAWPNYDRPPHLQSDPSYVPNKISHNYSSASHARLVRKNKNRPPKRERERLAALAEASRLAAGDLPVERPKGPAMTPKGSKHMRTSQPRTSQSEPPVKKVKTVQSIRIEIRNEVHKEQMLSDQEFTFIMDLLLQKWDKFPANSNFVPKFNGHGCDKGIGWILCSDESTCNWTLQTLMDIAQQMEPHVKIRAKTVSDILPGLNLAKVEVPFAVGNTTALVFDRLTRANKGLVTNKWVIKQADPPSDKAWNLVLNIDDASVDFLRKLDFQPFYGLGRVTFKVDDARKKDSSKPRSTHSSSHSPRSPQKSQNPSQRRPQGHRNVPMHSQSNFARHSSNFPNNSLFKQRQPPPEIWNQSMFSQNGDFLAGYNGGYNDNGGNGQFSNFRGNFNRNGQLGNFGGQMGNFGNSGNPFNQMMDLSTRNMRGNNGNNQNFRDSMNNKQSRNHFY